MNFANLDLNILMGLVAAVIGLINTVIIVKSNAKARATALETQVIVKKTEAKAEKVEKIKQERDRMADLLDDVLKRNGKRK